MKKIFFTIATLFGIWAGTNSFQTNSASAQTSAFTLTIIPLTNQVPFTNTLAPPTNLSTIQLSNVVTLLLTLETNIEETLPVLDLVQSNAVVVSITPTNPLLGLSAPLTSNPAGQLLTPTGAGSGAVAQHQTSLAVKIGTNTFGIDAPTLQALFILRGNLQQSLAVLQELNGTTPTPTNSLSLPQFFIMPPITNFSPGPLTNQFTVPPTNLTPFVMSDNTPLF